MSDPVLKYSLSVIKSHALCKSYPEHVVPVNGLIKTNHGEGVLFGDSVALDMDELEKVLAPKDERGRSTPKPSVDLAVGITDGIHAKYLLAEFKIDVQSRRGLNKTELIEKYEQSKIHVENYDLFPVSSEYPVVLGEHERTEEQKRKLTNWSLEFNGSFKT